MRRTPLLLLAAPLLAASPALAAAPIVSHTCPNGLEVLVVEDHALPLFTVEIAAKNGSMTEPPEFNGLSHLYEHMFFKANKALPSQEAYLARIRELGIEFAVALGIQVLGGSITFEFVDRLDQLDAGRFEQLGHRRQGRIELGQLACIGGAVRKQGRGRVLVVAVERVDQLLTALQQRGGMRKATMVVDEARIRLAGKGMFLQFLMLETQVVEAVRIAFFGAGQFGDAAVEIGDAARGAGHALDAVRMLGEGVEQGELVLARQQGLMLVLTMDLDQEAGGFAQHRQRHRTVVEPGARAAVAAHDAAQAQLFLVIQFLLAQPGAGLGQGAQVEFGRHLGAFGAMADHPGIAATAGQQHQGIDQQRLAGTGLAGKDSQSDRKSTRLNSSH